MHRYVLVSGLFLVLLACVQLLRLILGWEVTVADYVRCRAICGGALRAR